jgi:hypothetical protein
MASIETRCWRCAAVMAPHERFCAACGAGMGSGTSVATPPTAPRDPAESTSISKARKWLLAISILTLVTGAFFYIYQRGEVEKQIRDAEAQTAFMDPAERDALLKSQIGMTWAEAVKHDRGQVNLLLGINIVLAAIYFGLFYWARRNALAATVTALLLFITVHAINAVLDPKTLMYGILIKVLVIAALAAAISAAQRERKLAT